MRARTLKDNLWIHTFGMALAMAAGVAATSLSAHGWSWSWGAPALCPALAPAGGMAHYVLNEQVLSVGLSYRVGLEGRGVAWIRESDSGVFVLADTQGAVIAVGTARELAWGDQLDLTDCHGSVLGYVQARAGMYWILGPAGQFLARSVAAPVPAELAEALRFDSFREQTVLAAERPAGKLPGTDWNLKLLDPRAIDGRAALLVPVFKTWLDRAQLRLQ